MTQPRTFCSTISEAGDEPLVGTASRVINWLLLEQAGPWRYDVAFDDRASPEAAERLGARLRELGIRLVLIRRGDTRRSGRRHVYLAHTGAMTCFIEHGEVDDPAELLEADLSQLTQGQAVGIGTIEPRPIYLVCTHGKHDVCCSVRGKPTAKVLSNRLPGQVWECSHIGGDRFAGNLVCFPHGVYYGRVGADEAPGIVADYERGIIDLDHYRGRCCYPTVVQAAEDFVRRTEGLSGINEVVAESSVKLSHNTAGVRISLPGGRRVQAIVRATREREAVLLTCRARHPNHPRRFELISLAVV